MLLADIRRALLEQRAQVESPHGELRTPCTVSDVWRGVTPRCSPRYTPPDSLRARHAAGLLANTRYRYTESSRRGALVLLTVRQSASAAEQVVALLVDDGGARSVGAPTMGVGCGFTRGGIPFVLPKSRLDVRLPDCLPLRRDGRNERAGIAPTMSPHWDAKDDGATRANKLVQAL